MKKALEIRQAMSRSLDDWKKALEARDAETDVEKRKALSDKAKSLQAEHNRLKDELDEAEALEAEELRMAGNAAKRSKTDKGSPEEQAAKQYSVIRAIATIASGKPLDGLEAEMEQEAEKEARQSNISLSGNIKIPSFALRGVNLGEKRDQTVGTAANGGYTVQTDLGELVPILRPRLVAERLGATMLSGLVGNLDIPRQASKLSAAWEGENTDADETTATFELLQLRPRRLAAFTDLSKKWLVQSSVPAENFVRNDLNRAVREALESAIINGATGGNNPVGILNTSGIGSVAVGTNGGAPTWAHMISLWKEIAGDNADIEMLNFLTTPGVAAQLMQTEKAASTAQFVWNSNNAVGNVNGYGAYTSTLVPSTLTKGSSTDCHAIIFGNWSDLIIAQWAGIDIVVDPFTGAKQNMLTITINSHWDTVVRHPESFAAVKDARVTI